MGLSDWEGRFTGEVGILKPEKMLERISKFASYLLMPWVSFQSVRFCSNSLQFCSRECSCIILVQPRNCGSWFHFLSTSVLPPPSPRWHHSCFSSLTLCELITAFLPNLHLHKRAILRLQAHFNAQNIKTNWKLKKLQSHAKSFGETALKCVGAWQTAVETGAAYS